MKKKIFLSLVGLFLIFILSAHAFSLTLYDDFSGTYIDRTKWIYGELIREIREIEQGNYKLILKQASPNPIVAASYPYYENNSLIFIDPNSVNSIQADVTILKNSITNSGGTTAACVGNWYNDGTPGEGMIGDIQVGVTLKGESSGLFARWVVYKMTNPEGTTWTDLAGGDFTTPITNGTTYTLNIEYDSVNNRFIFRVGEEQIEFSTGLPPRAGNAKIPFKALATRVRIDDENSSAFIYATFDNIYKNGLPYENFSSSTIDPTKWATYEFVREISNGKLRTKVRTGSASSNDPVNCWLPSLVAIKAAQAKVTLLNLQNPQGLYERVGITGAFFNDGTPGEWQIGDVQAVVQIASTWLTLQPEWEVLRCADSECDNTETLATGVFTTPIVLGNTYTLFIEWDGSQFTLKFNDEVAHYTPTSIITMNPAKLPLIDLNTKVHPSPGHKEATIEALYDEVMAIRVGTATRNLPDYYSPSVPLTVTITATPSETTNSYAVEDVPPSGWTVSNINESGVWDSLNNKVKWGPFFDHNTRTLTYQVTPPAGETGSKTFSGTASFDGTSVTISGDLTVGSCSFHPADTDHDYRMGINEVTAYGSAWKTGQSWSTPPNPIPIEYVTNAGYLWRYGEAYHCDSTKTPPWVPGTSAVAGQFQKGKIALEVSPNPSATGSAVRDLPNIYAPSVTVPVSIYVTPDSTTLSYAVEDVPPIGWVVSSINENGQWDYNNERVKWGPFFDHNTRTLTYQATPPPGETGEKSFSGTASFDGNNVTISGDSTINIFSDIPTDYWAYNYIIAIYNAHITTGCSQSPLKYCPEDYVTRGQMAAFIIRAKYGETFSYTTTPYFTDVPSTHTFFKYVQKLRDDGITAVSGTYAVDSYVTRGQMAAFIIRAKHGETFSYTTTPYFSDVPSTHNFFKYVQKLKDEGITAVSGTYGVDDIVTRAQMAAFLARAFLGME